ncbi:hypothetical protein NUW54_g9581 [Trametes sanguinea]|uniref:Uncharacterized protein n=1 Tax=Trametes sanguinea TaxID=158606 RepID=A0ACC1P730_9APHY|nr:hypothetical protein NUW54_g9581 [Trametes sanguinea]
MRPSPLPVVLRELLVCLGSPAAQYAAAAAAAAAGYRVASRVLQPWATLPRYAVHIEHRPHASLSATFSLTIGGVAQHLISYYKIEDVEQGRLRSPSSLPELASLTISPEYLDKTHFRNPPKVEIGVDGIPRYRGEADDVELSPRLLPAPLSSGGYYGEADAGSVKPLSEEEQLGF